MRTLKYIVVGDGAVGKRCLLAAYTSSRFEADDSCALFLQYAKQVKIGEQTLQLELHHTPGQDEYSQSRSETYTNSDIILVCFSVANPTSFTNVAQYWMPEICRTCSQNVPIFLVGLQKDRRSDPETIENLKRKDKKPVSFEQGLALMKSIHARKYMGKFAEF
jgi:small GTP-binding protein